MTRIILRRPRRSESRPTNRPAMAQLKDGPSDQADLQVAEFEFR
jgi:hypothetical protein